MQISSNGQITIPPQIQHQLGLLPGTEVELEVVGNTLLLRKRSPLQSDSPLIAAMRGKATVKMSTDDILKMTRLEP